MALPSLDEWKAICAGAPCLIPDYAAEYLHEKLAEFKPKPKGEGANVFMATYIDLCRQLHGFTPNTKGVSAGLAKTIVKDHGVQTACELVGTYLRMKDSRFLQNSYDLRTMQMFIQVVLRQHETGRSVNRTGAGQAEKVDANMQALQEYRSKKGKA